MIKYFSEDTSYIFKSKRYNSSWLTEVARKEGKTIGDISVIFCSDSYLLDINKKYLGHDYYTDIITFDYCQGDVLSGDLFISVDTVKDNASFYKTQFNEEIHRVVVHGLLHLIGYDDHSDEDQKLMRFKENEYLKFYGEAL